MKKIPRYYQKDACNSVVKAWKNKEIPCISMMTALGKALCAAMLANYGLKKGLRVLCLVPTSELATQNFEEAINNIDDEFKSKIGLVCAQLNKKQNHLNFVIAMYQSFINLRAISGNFGMIIIDEAHLVSNNENSQIRKIVRSLQRINKDVLIVGMTASPYRLGQGLLTEKCIKGVPLFTSICYDTSINPGIKKLIDEKSLAKIEVINTHYQIDLTGVKMSGHEYNQNDVGLKFEMICDDAVEDFRQGFIDENVETALIFVPNCSAGKRVINCWNDQSTMRMVSNESSDYERKDAVEWFKYGKGSRYLVNVNIYTTGFNFPALQAVVMLRATTSPGLLIQILGRLIRPYGDMVGKFWDYGSNLSRLGGIEDIIVPKPKKRRSEAPKKLCTAIIETPVMYEELHYRVGDVCGYPNLLSAKKCKICEAEFIPMGEEGKYSMRTKGEALAKKAAEMVFTYDVTAVFFDEAISKKSGIRMIKMSFYGEYSEFLANDYLCIEHTGQAKNIATAKIMNMLKNKRDYYQMSKFEGGVSVKSVLFLLGEEYFNQFFKQIKTVTIAREGHFDKVRSWEY